jgi:hypothetical protein
MLVGKLMTWTIVYEGWLKFQNCRDQEFKFIELVGSMN